MLNRNALAVGGAVLAMLPLTAFGQRLERTTWELVINVVNGRAGQKITFHATKCYPTVWDCHGMVTAESKYVSPEDVDVWLNTDGKGSGGWDTAEGTSPCLGRSYYTVKSTTGVAYLSVDTYGLVQTFQRDVEVTYDALEDAFEPADVDMYDNVEALQPTPPLNFTCTNAGQSGQHPHFVWERPEAPEGVRCCRRTHHP